MEMNRQVVNGLRIAKALASDYFIIYYVDIETDRFMEFSATNEFQGLGIEQEGENFFEVSRKNAQRVVHPDDRATFISAFSKENLLRTLERESTFLLTYRQLLGREYRRVQMKATRMGDGDFTHVVIGVNDIEAQSRAQEEYLRAKEAGLTYSRIAQVLAEDYIAIYYVDMETERFMEFSADNGYAGLDIEKRGTDFFALSRQNALRVIHKEDRPGFLAAFTKENIERELDANGVFKLTYRLLFDGTPTYVMAKVTRMKEKDGNHIVIGINNIDDQIKHRQAMEKLREERIAYGRFFALAGDYICIYTVDPETCQYTEYRANKDYEGLGLAKRGEKFFTQSRTDSMKALHPDDLERFNAQFTRENVLGSIAKQGHFTINYRLMLEGREVYCSLKAALVEENDRPVLVVGVMNVNDQVRRDREYARTLSAAENKASVDALTGVKNKHAYAELEKELNNRIEAGEPLEFAVVVFDVNGLKTVNDTRGHQAGDMYLKRACEIICKIFKHSPVFRVGGDEFAVISQGSDYEAIRELMARMSESNIQNESDGGAVIACGMARFERDRSVSAVFNRADARMYENKKDLKENE